MSDGRTLIALKSYSPTDSIVGIHFKKNDLFRLIRRTVNYKGHEREDLLFVQHSMGRYGYAPSSHLVFHQEPPPFVPPGKYKATLTHHTNIDGHLKIAPGDILTVIQCQKEQGLLLGRKKKSIGLFPASVVDSDNILTFQFSVKAICPQTSEEHFGFAANENLDVLLTFSEQSKYHDYWIVRDGNGTIGLARHCALQENLGITQSVLLKHLWYHNGIGRYNANQILKDLPAGNFIIRDSNTPPGSLTLSIRGSGRCIVHVKIDVDVATFHYVIKGTSFLSLHALVEFYRNTPVWISEDGKQRLRLIQAAVRPV